MFNFMEIYLGTESGLISSKRGVRITSITLFILLTILFISCSAKDRRKTSYLLDHIVIDRVDTRVDLSINDSNGNYWGELIFYVKQNRVIFIANDGTKWNRSVSEIESVYVDQDVSDGLLVLKFKKESEGHYFCRLSFDQWAILESFLKEHLPMDTIN